MFHKRFGKQKACKGCGSVERPHKGFGYCLICYKREYMKQYMRKWRKNKGKNDISTA